jgi:hypothetical protein
MLRRTAPPHDLLGFPHTSILAKAGTDELVFIILICKLRALLRNEHVLPRVSFRAKE